MHKLKAIIVLVLMVITVCTVVYCVIELPPQHLWIVFWGEVIVLSILSATWRFLSPHRHEDSWRPVVHIKSLIFWSVFYMVLPLNFIQYPLFVALSIVIGSILIAVGTGYLYVWFADKFSLRQTITYSIPLL